MEITQFRLTYEGEARTRANSCKGVDGPAKKHTFTLSHPDGWRLNLACLEFENGERDVRCEDYSKGTPSILHTLAGRLRLGIRETDEEVPRWQVRMRQTQLLPNAHPPRATAKKVSEEQLDRGAGLPVRAHLRSLGGTLGTRSELLGDDGRNRTEIIALAPCGSREFMVAAYVLARVLPLLGSACS